MIIPTEQGGTAAARAAAEAMDVMSPENCHRGGPEPTCSGPPFSITQEAYHIHTYHLAIFEIRTFHKMILFQD